MLQRHRIGPIYTHTEAHADSEKVESFKKRSRFSLYFVAAPTLMPPLPSALVFCFHLQLLPAVPAGGRGEHGLREVSELRSDAADSRRPHRSLRAALLRKGAHLSFRLNMHCQI